jgi:hypothetical protein
LKNSSFEQLLEFKKLAMSLLYRISIEISRIFPDIQSEQAFQFLTLSYAAMANFWAENSQSEALKKIYQLEEFAALTPNFKKDLTTSIETIIRGLRAS